MARAVLAVAASLVAVAPIAAAAPRTSDPDTLLAQLHLAPATVPGTAAELQASVLNRLGEVQAAVRKCNQALPKAFQGKSADQVLRSIAQGAGQTFTLTPAAFAALRRAAGDALDLAPAELDLCIRARDMDIGRAPANGGLTMRQIDRTLQQCLSLARSGVPNPAAFKVITGLDQRPGSDSYTDAGTLTALNRAYRRSTGLTRVDLETCAAAYDMHKMASLARGDNYANVRGPFCDPGTQETCVGTDGNWTCCNTADSVCSQTCSPEGGDCVAWCQERWSCFPGDATVVTEGGGTKAMRNVQIGDRVQVVRADGSLGFEDVYLMTHHDALVRQPYIRLTLDSGRALTLSPRHFIPVASDATAGWQAAVTRGADEVRAGDRIWYRAETGAMAAAMVTATATVPATGAFNPLTEGGTILVDGVVASAHSDWFLDGWVAAATEAAVYQAMFAPVRAIYAVIGPDWTRRITQEWGVVDTVRDATAMLSRQAGWTLGGALLLALAAVLLRSRRMAAR